MCISDNTNLNAASGGDVTLYNFTTYVFYIK